MADAIDGRKSAESAANAASGQVNDDLMALTAELLAIRRKCEASLVLIRTVGALGAGLLVMSMVPSFFAARSIAGVEAGIAAQQTTINELRERAAKQEELLNKCDVKIEAQYRLNLELGNELDKIRRKM